jgi:GntR family transcriptional regulator
MHTKMWISQASDRPMYVQIMDQARRLIASGAWRPGDEIPSIRALAADLAVSLITVKRAYLELEREGLLVTRQGKGTFVSDARKDLGLRLRNKELRRHLDQLIDVARTLGLEWDELQERLARLWNREVKERP